MKTISRLAPALVALTCLSILPAVASAETAPPTTPTPAIPAPATPAPPAAGKIKLVLQKVSGKPRFAATGQRVVVRGIVIPYVAGQSVKMSFYLDGHKISVKNVSVLALGNGAGQFHVGIASRNAGLLQARAAHYATPQQAAFAGKSASVRIANPNVGPGSSGESVRLLQDELSALHYAVPTNGVFDEATGRALIAFRKMTGMNRIPAAGSEVFKALSRGEGAFHVLYPHDGRHVEANLTKQVLAEIEPGGRIHAIYTVSSGKPSTPTVIGRFSVYRKEPGTNSEGMVDSNYFIRGYAIHGYAEVPTYAASHGCLRVPVPDAPTIYAWVREGTPVDVYNQSGGGSTHVRSNAGP
jgi:peptidoglycan hydrolase-like protein with peptidoglycan-binding domain